MDIAKRALHFLLIGTVVSWHMPIAQLAAQEAPHAIAAAPEIHPIAVVLVGDRMLQGTSITRDGKPASGQTVVLGQKGKVVSKTTADAQGRFQFTIQKPGDYQIASADAAAFVTCCTAATAPSNAVKQILISQDAMIARGQQPLSVLLHPLLIALVIAAAIVIPIAVSNNKDDAS
ncbi:Nickel uptake substrate-specific transmembrane region [Rosistilla carotiformis]|uniref:Nickel uptake substrate-specific transmembrane region n=1 Tax=Rosistilla carotiformis TaxID=2528017 RepID=A0A518JUH2_9BACT|nr:hypothetical protein [Rosistilla carotiformis]QDV69193.1 Nickel uptake substrate-specific transmembrane region [Rosistilla carotiformis]